MVHHLAFNTIIAGNVFFETIINKNNQIFLDQPGGSALYAASGFHLWKKPAGIIAKISEDKPIDWTNKFETAGFEISGIRKVPSAFEQRKFYVVTDDQHIETDNPQKHFFMRNKPLPKFLLGYATQQQSTESSRIASIDSISQDDLPDRYLQTNNILLAPMDYYSHSMLPPYFRSKTDGNVFFCASEHYMKPAFWYDFPPLIRGSTTFLSTTNQMHDLFLGKMDDIWEMITFTANCGVDIVCVFNPDGKHFLYDRLADKKYEIPNYSSDVIDPIGTYETFCGGFCSGYITHFNPLESALMGSVSASFKVEGSTPRYVMQTLPDLAIARKDMLINHIKTV